MLLTLLEQHLNRQPPTVVKQATTWWETVLALVKLQGIGLGVHLPVKVCYYTLCACGPFVSILRILLGPFLDRNDDASRLWMTDFNMCEYLSTFPAYCAYSTVVFGFRIICHTHSLQMRLAELIVHLKNKEKLLKVSSCDMSPANVCSVCL